MRLRIVSEEADSVHLARHYLKGMRESDSASGTVADLRRLCLEQLEAPVWARCASSLYPQECPQ